MRQLNASRVTRAGVSRPDAAAPTGRNIFSKIEVRSTRFLLKKKSCPQGQFFSKFSFAKQKKFCQNKKNKKIKIKKPLKIAFLGVFLLE